MSAQPAKGSDSAVPIDRTFVFFIIFTILLGLSLAVFYWKFGEKHLLSTKPYSLIDTSTLNLVNRQKQERFAELIMVDPGKTATVNSENLITAFRILYVDYFYEPSANKREALSKIISYLEKENPNELKKANIQVPCLEASCGFGAYPDDLKVLKDSFESNGEISKDKQKTLLINLQAVAISRFEKNKDAEFNTLLALHLTLSGLNKQDSSGKLSSELIEVEDMLKSVNEEAYLQYKKQGRLD